MTKSSAGKDAFIVPEGYELVIFDQASTASFGKTRAGVVIADFGPQHHLAQSFETVEGLVRENPTGPIVWVFQKTALEYWTSDTVRISALLRRFHRVLQLRSELAGSAAINPLLLLAPYAYLSDAFKPDPPIVQGYVVDYVCVDNFSPAAHALMTLVDVLGCSRGTPDEEHRVFMEVIRPDGVVIVMLPGSPLAPPEKKPDLARIYRERDAAAEAPDSEARLAELEAEEAACIEQTIHDATPFGRRLLGGSKPGGDHPLLSERMSGITRAKLPAFVKAFAASTVGVTVEDGTLIATNSGDGQERLLVCADPPLFEMRYERRFNRLMTGIDVFKTVQANPDCAGVYVNNALKEAGVIIGREDAIKALKR